MSTTRVTVPQLGESVHEGTISKWLVQPGDQVVEFEPMLEVDTDKVSAEVPAPVTGVLKEIIAKEGETVQAGAEIAVVEVDGDTPSPQGGEGRDGAAAEPKAEEPKREEPKAEAKSAPAPKPAPAPTPSPSPEGRGAGEHRYSPAVTMLAEEKGVDLGQVPGTGIGGRVTKRDVRQFLESEAKPAAPARPTPSPSPEVRGTPGEGDEVVPLTRIRKLIADNMTRSK